MATSDLPEEAQPDDADGLDGGAHGPRSGPVDPPEPSEPAEPPPARRRASRRAVATAAAVLLLGGALLAYRVHHRHRVIALAMARAERLIALDTAAGYRGAAEVLEPVSPLDPLGAGSMRAFALAWLAADYREPSLGAEADGLIVEPGRADPVPVWADLAASTLALGRGAVGDGATYVSRAGASPWAGAIEGRLALAAGNPEAGIEPARNATAAAPALAAAFAVEGDLLRRGRQDAAGARAAYAAALARSPVHPRAAYGLAKLALAGSCPLSTALEPLRRLAADGVTPSAERGRAGLHLAALELRAGDRDAARAALEAIPGLDGPGRLWAERAARTEAQTRGIYRAVRGAPAALSSASDDDPPEIPLAPVTPPRPPPPAPEAVHRPPPHHLHAPAKKKGTRATTPRAAPRRPTSG